MKIENERNNKIEELIQKLQLDLYGLKMVFDDIKSNTEDRIKHELEFRKTCFAITSKTWQLMEDVGYGKQFSGVPPEQYGEPAYKHHELEGDVSDLTNFVNSYADTINDKKVESTLEEVADVTKDEWRNHLEKIRVEYLYKAAQEEEKYKNILKDVQKKRNLTFFPDIAIANIIFDEDIINAAKGFMVGPVGIFRNKCVAAIVGKSFKSLEELKADILVNSALRDMVLYMVYEKAGQYFWRGVFVDKV